MKKTIAWLLTLMIVLTQPVLAMAASDGYDMTTFCYMNDEPVDGVMIQLYTVGNIEGTTFTWNDEYAGIDVPDIESAASLQEAAKAASARIQGSGHEPSFTGVSDAGGQVLFQDVPNGVYCVLGVTYQKDNKIYDVIPVLVFVNQDTSIELKASVKDIHVDKENKTSVSVQKTWVLSDGKTASPVTIGLMRNGALTDTVVLSTENDWE